MWPKAIAQLVEFLPHAARLLPMADKFLQSRAATDDSARRAMDAMAEGLRGDLGQVTASHAGLYRQLNDQSEKLSEVLSETRAARGAVEVAETRITRLENRLDRMAILLLVGMVISIALLVIVSVLLHRTHA